MPKPWTLTKDLQESEYLIFEKTLKENQKKAGICSGLINLLYEELKLIEGKELLEVYPINSEIKAKNFLIVVYASSAFLYSSTAFDLAARGHYLESEGILRSLIENVAFAEYFHLNPDKAYVFFNSLKGMPDKKKVFRYLKEHGSFPKDGPEKVIARFHSSAHANIHARFKSWLITNNDNKIVGFNTHQYHKESFNKISHHLIMPLIGTQQFLYEVFENRYSQNKDFLYKWNSVRQMKLILEEFPDLWFIEGLK